jgi:hypothetical protein
MPPNPRVRDAYFKEVQDVLSKFIDDPATYADPTEPPAGS